MRRGKKVYEPPKFMTINTAIEQLLDVEADCGESGNIIIFSPLFFITCVGRLCKWLFGFLLSIPANENKVSPNRC